MRTQFVFAALILLLTIGCSTGGNTPSAPDAQFETRSLSDSATHSLWGYWQGVIDPDAQTIDLTPLRETSMHLNALRFLEPPPLVNLTLESLKFNGDIIEADIGLRHQLLGLTEFTGFDVCGIFITNGSYSGYDNPDLVMAVDGDTRLLNADGFSRWWNPAEFPVNEGTMFSYNDGLLGTPDAVGNYNATLNGYKYFCNDFVNPDDPLDIIQLEHRGMFSAGSKNIRHYTIKLDGGLIFNYAVDACWQFPTGGKPWTPPDDFGPGANRPEPYRIVVHEDSNTLWNDGDTNGGDLGLAIDVYDWFNADMNTVRVESPGNFAIVESASASGGGEGYSTYEIEITGATPAEGSIELLISVESDVVGYGGLLPGEPVTAYFTHSVDVSAEPPITDNGWVVTFGDTGTEYILGYGIDSQGGKYSCGYFFDQTNLDPDGNDPHPGVGGGNMWFNKLDKNGKFEWGYTWPSIDGYHSYVWEIVVDKDDYVYIVGHFVSTIDFDPGDGVDMHTASGGNGRLDAFLMKFNSDGEYIWGYSWGGTEDVTAFDIAIDDYGYLYITGYFFGTADIDPTSGVEMHTATSGSGNVTDAYLIKMDTEGNYYWGRTFGAESTTYGFRVAVDGNGDPTATGTFYDTADFDPTGGVYHLTANGLTDVFIIKFDTDGAWQWSLSFGGDSWDQVNAMIADADGYIYMNGGSSSTVVDYDPGPGDNSIPGQGSYDGFLVALDKDGIFQWVDIFGEVLHDNTWGITLDGSNNIYMCGHFQGTIDLDPGPGVDSHSTAGDSDCYVVKLTSDGDYIWGNSWGGPDYQTSYSVEVDPTGFVNVAGRFASTTDFDPGPGVEERTSNGNYDTFINMLLPTGGW